MYETLRVITDNTDEVTTFIFPIQFMQNPSSYKYLLSRYLFNQEGKRSAHPIRYSQMIPPKAQFSKLAK